MRHAVLSISEERVAGAIRNTVLAHSGYGVIPASNTREALRILGSRHVCAMVIPSSIPQDDQQMLCTEGKKRGVASVVLDPYGALNSGDREVHFNPLDGPEAFLQVLESAVRRDHRLCIA
jgi:DNA-binding NtrC family response regulator